MTDDAPDEVRRAAVQTDAYQAVAEAYNRLEGLVREARAGGDTGTLLHQLGRWRERTSNELETRVRRGEGRKLLYLDLPAYDFGLTSNVLEAAAEHGRFLYALANEIERQPDDFLPGTIARANREREKADREERRSDERRSLGVPEKPTLGWLWAAIPAGWMMAAVLALAGLLWATFSAGVRVGRSPEALRTFGPLVGISADPAPPRAPAAETAPVTGGTGGTGGAKR